MGADVKPGILKGKILYKNIHGKPKIKCNIKIIVLSLQAG
jgi:hypothetical protein